MQIRVIWFLLLVKCRIKVAVSVSFFFRKNIRSLNKLRIEYFAKRLRVDSGTQFFSYPAAYILAATPLVLLRAPVD